MPLVWICNPTNIYFKLKLQLPAGLSWKFRPAKIMCEL